ncbi:MAG: ClbS/DfsB family four-helix bundle protein [Caldilinea sp. CFX5]|nr:ClbS/DfsB family four-helix bundle protein [Caldilinea sp. CFX5]
MNKAQFLQTLRDEQTNWEQFLHSIPITQREAAGLYGHWSVKDVVGHVVAWERYMTARLRAHLRNEPATSPELWGDFIPPTDLSDDALNDWMAAQLSSRSFDVILAMQQAVRAQLIDTVQATSEELLTTIGLRVKGLPYHQDDPFWQIIASMSYNHAQDHLTRLRQALAQVA